MIFVMKKWFVQASLVMIAVFLSPGPSFAGQEIKTASSGESLGADADLVQADIGARDFLDPEYAPMDSRKKPKPSRASKNSQSRRHTGSPSQSYGAPSSGSIRPGTLGGSRATPTPSNNLQASGQGKPPLRMSHRDRYFGLGSRELGLNIGTVHAFTDLQGTKGLPFGESLNFQIKNPGIALGLYSRLRMVDWFGLSLGIDFARISGEDNGSMEEYEGYSFENNLLEFNARIAFYAPISSKNVFDIYGFAGLALFNNSLSLMNAEGVPVEPRGEFRNLQPALPFGIGFSWMAGYRVVVGFEAGYRYSAFNYLDGIAPVNTRYDSYLFTNFKIGYILNPPRN